MLTVILIISCAVLLSGTIYCGANLLKKSKQLEEFKTISDLKREEDSYRKKIFDLENKQSLINSEIDRLNKEESRISTSISKIKPET